MKLSYSIAFLHKNCSSVGYLYQELAIAMYIINGSYYSEICVHVYDPGILNLTFETRKKKLTDVPICH